MTPNRRRSNSNAARRSSGDDPGETITKAAENYLLSIYMVREQGLAVTNSNLVAQLRRIPESEGLGTSAPSIAGMLKRMREDGLITVGERRDINLTSRGKTHAERIVRRHRLAERLVVDLLGLDLASAHVEAHRLEHALSDALEDRISITLGNPSTCPFGHPIPGSGARPSGKAAVPLSDTPVGTSVVIDRIPEEDQELLGYLIDSGILPDISVQILDVAPYRGVLSLKVGDSEAVLGLEVANRVWVRRL
jgi:DtxR family Mn-dependent transcriptional regulator